MLLSVYACVLIHLFLCQMDLVLIYETPLILHRYISYINQFDLSHCNIL